jgi:acetyl esterase/lipase
MANKAFLYEPKILENSNKEARPLVIYFHGGGFIMSSPDNWRTDSHVCL